MSRWAVCCFVLAVVPSLCAPAPAIEADKALLAQQWSNTAKPGEPLPEGTISDAGQISVSDTAGMMKEDDHTLKPRGETQETVPVAPPAPEASTKAEDAPAPKPEEAPAAKSDVATTMKIAMPDPKAETSAASMVIAIPTMRRWTKEGEIAPYKYLTSLVDGIEASMSADQKKSVSYLMYNVDKEPEKHAELAAIKDKLGDRVEIMVKNQPGTVKDSGDANQKVSLTYGDGIEREVTKQTANWVAGETRDATNLMFEARKRAPYVMFCEDDVKPTSNLITKVNDYLGEMKKAGKDDWFMIDLYTPNINWGRNPLMVKPLERYDYECCTQAMLFRSDKLLDLLLFETLHPSTPIDDNIRSFAREDWDARGVYALYPNGFEHIGKHSSNPEKSSDTVEHVSLNFVP